MKKYVVITFDREEYLRFARDVMHINPADEPQWLMERYKEFTESVTTQFKHLLDNDIIIVDKYCTTFETAYGDLTVAHAVTGVDGVAIRCTNCNALLEVPTGDDAQDAST